MREIVKRETIDTSVDVCFKLVLWWQWRVCIESRQVGDVGDGLVEGGDAFVVALYRQQQERRPRPGSIYICKNI